ncbi:hypothetical protein OPV22_021183 [Ensete ventricosum]|uniref:Uncharacterized protein n=1 Tax=Ensete ventricosum TaxID=4639 RepID=A0AAV8PAM2_ENSVE|nr:hypothetical protein OPV22_021183 [Ensete ventricosum]
METIIEPDPIGPQPGSSEPIQEHFGVPSSSISKETLPSSPVSLEYSPTVPETPSFDLAVSRSTRVQVFRSCISGEDERPEEGDGACDSRDLPQVRRAFQISSMAYDLATCCQFNQF